VSAEHEIALLVEHVSKSFPGVKALDDVHFELRKGEVHCLIGENGAGKSTFIKILGGIYQPDEGQIYIDGQSVTISNVSDAQKNGISIIHQELCLASNLTVADNIYLGREPLKPGSRMIDVKKKNKDTEALFEKLGIEQIDPADLVSALKTSKQQMVEIAKALSMKAKIIIMDEPSSSLTNNEVEHLFGFMKTLKEKNIPVIYISHRMDEVFEIGDRVTVFRDGAYIDTKEIAETSREELITMMVGRRTEEFFQDEEIGYTNEEVMRVTGLSRKNAFDDISFRVCKGEVLGFFGLTGAGRSETARAIFGIDKYEKGEIYIDGKKVLINSPKKAIRHGLALVPENRKEEGLILINHVKFNLTLTMLEEYIQHLTANKEVEKNIVDYYIEKLSIKAPDKTSLCVNMSGGNQQKVVLGKWLATAPKILILDEPTRGIDVGTKSEIYRIIRNLAKEGIAVILISSELPEIVNLSTRVIVMYEGRITADIKEKDEINQLNIMHYAIGGSRGANSSTGG